MLSTLLLGLLLPLASYAEVLEKISLGRSLTKESGCKFKFDESKREFNLCPLFSDSGRAQGSITWEDKTPPTKSKTEIDWNFGGPLDRVEERKESDQCPEGTWICLKVTNRKLIDPPEVTPRITRLIPIAGELVASSKHGEHEGHDDEDIIENNTKIDITASLETTRWSKGEAVLHLRLHGGKYVQKPQHAVFTMRCEHDAEDVTNPTYPYGGAWNGTHYFTWRTRHACVSVQATPIPEHGDGGKGKNEEDSEKLPNDEGDSLAPAPRTSTGWKITTWVFACLLLGGLLFHLARTDRLPVKRIYPALRTFAMYHPLAPLYRRFTFRVGETGFGVLRWARRRAGYESVGREQMLFDSELDETGDWINGRSGSDEDRTVVGDDEVLPVTSPSPRKGSFGIKSYGTR